MLTKASKNLTFGNIVLRYGMKARRWQASQANISFRHAGKEWFVGVMNGLTARDITVNTVDFLTKGKKYQVEIYNDDPTLNTRTKVSSYKTTVKAGKAIKLHLQASGGAALRFVEQ